MNIKTIYIEPGSPWQNQYIESFYARFRKELVVTTKTGTVEKLVWVT